MKLSKKNRLRLKKAMETIWNGTCGVKNPLKKATWKLSDFKAWLK